jgi:hypothetical protein
LQRKTVKDGNPRYFFSKDKEIIPFIEAYWESITTLARKQTTGWYSTIQKTLQTHANIFASQDNNGDLMFGLIEKDLETIKPNYDALKVNQKEDGKFFPARFITTTTKTCKQNKISRWAYKSTFFFVSLRP